MLEWIYCDSVQNLEEEVALELFQVADKFLVGELKDVCEEYLVKHLRVDNVIDRAILGNLVDSSKLIKAATNLIMKHIDELFEKDDIRRLPNPILKSICKGGK